MTDLPENYLSKLTTNPQNVHTLAAVRNFTQHFPPEDYPRRDTAVWDAVLDTYHGMNNTTPAFWGNYTRGLYLAGPLGLTGSLKNHSLDAFVLPTYYASHFPAVLGARESCSSFFSNPSSLAVLLSLQDQLSLTYLF